ncbi:MAG: hypothetical protein WCO00_10280 [Rhodospirillaceae bacterium]
MIPKMVLHTLAAMVLVTGLAGAWQIWAGPGSGFAPVAGQQEGSRHDD